MIILVTLSNETRGRNFNV